MNNPVRLTVVAVVLAMGLVLSSLVLSRFFVSVKHEKAITVKGYAESDVTSDIGKFSCSYRVRGTNLQEAYDKLRTGRTVVVDYLKRKGFAESEVNTDTIQTEKINKRSEGGTELNEVQYYDASQSISVASTNVGLVKAASTDITELIKEGIDISVGSPQFLVSDLKDIKLKLLAKATDDGYRRALALAENSRAKVGALVSAEQGVLQITKRHSTDTSGYGMYDTSTIEKTVKAVVTLEYRIDAK